MVKSTLNGVAIDYIFGLPDEGKDVVWRCEAKRYSYVVDADREEYGVTDPKLEVFYIEVKKRTAKCAYIYGGEFITLYAKRCKWRNTPEEALEQFKQRRIRQIKILKGQLKYAEAELLLTETPEAKAVRTYRNRQRADSYHGA